MARRIRSGLSHNNRRRAVARFPERTGETIYVCRISQPEGRDPATATGNGVIQMDTQTLTDTASALSPATRACWLWTKAIPPATGDLPPWAFRRPRKPARLSRHDRDHARPGESSAAQSSTTRRSARRKKMARPSLSHHRCGNHPRHQSGYWRQGMAGHPGEKITEGLDGLRDRLAEYARMGARFAKWRAVIAIGDGLPSRGCIEANAQTLARYAALCQEAPWFPSLSRKCSWMAGRPWSSAARSQRKFCEQCSISFTRSG